MTKKELLEKSEEIIKKIENENNTEKLAEYLKESEQLSKDIELVSKRDQLLEKAKEFKNNSIKEVNIIKERQNSEKDKAHDIAKALKRGMGVTFSSSDLISKAVTTTTEGILLPNYSSNSLNDTLQTRSMLMDKVRVINLNGGESFTQPYVKFNNSEGDYTQEASKYNESDSSFGYAPITKSKITTMFTISEEIEKLPSVDYAGYMRSQLVEKIKAKISREIINGDGAQNHIRGILHNPTNTNEQIIAPATDLTINAISKEHLNNIIFSYGSENQDFYDNTQLILNKKDLLKYYQLTDAEGRKLLDINPRSKTIDGVDYIISNVIKDFDTAQSNEYIAVYGNLSNYLLAIFSDMEIQRSTENKFQEGMIVYKASIFVGGNVVVENGFTRIKKQ